MEKRRTMTLGLAILSVMMGVMAVAVLLWAAGSAGASPPRGPLAQGGAPLLLNYQGRLADPTTGLPKPDGPYTITFKIYDADTGGTLVWSETQVVTVTRGLFNVLLGSNTALSASDFDGTSRWLELEVEGETLSPRVRMVSAPYAIQAEEAKNAATAPWSGLTDVPAGFADGVDNDTTYTAGTGLTLGGTTFSADTTYLQRRVSGTCPAGNSIRVINADGTVTCELDDDSGGDITAVNTGTGLTGGGNNADVTLALDTAYTDGRYWSLTGNAGTTPDTHFLGTTDGVSLTLAVSGTAALQLEPNDTSPNLIGGYSGNSVTAGVVGATIGGGGRSGMTNRVTDDYGTVGGGWGNQAGDDAGTTLDRRWGTVGGGLWNTAIGEYATVSGGYDNEADGAYATVGGGQHNIAHGDGATVGGGGWYKQESPPLPPFYYPNLASGDYATISGGQGNTANGQHATIGGGFKHAATARYTTVGGGERNTASGSWATVGGGVYNRASGYYATVGGGSSNTAVGEHATVPGGRSNTAQGAHSFAAGRRAKANDDGAFVWGDSTDADINSSGVNQFIVRANGGIWFGAVTTDFTPTIGSGVFISTTTGAKLTTGGAWTDSSDRNAKENLALVDGEDVLASLAKVPIQTWNYKAEDPSVRHMGPTAQDFYAAFGLGADNRHIASLDTSGVGLAAIQALAAENAALRQRLDDLEARMAALEAASANSTASPQPLQSRLLPGAGVLLAGLGLVWLKRRGGE